MRNIKKAVSITLAATLLCSCGSSPVVKEQIEQTQITLSWWGNDKRNEYTLEAVELFEEQHPEIKVKCNYSEWSGYEARSRVQMNSDTEADVMQINVGWLSEYSADGKGYYDLDSLSEYVDLSCFPDKILDYGRMNGVLNAIPIAMNAETIYYNMDILNKYGISPPKTWDEVTAAAEILSKDNIYILAGASKSMWLYTLTYAEQVIGKPFLNEDETLAYTPEEVQVMIDFYCDMVKKKVFPQVEYYQKIDIDNNTYAGTIGWVSDAINYFSTVMDKGQNVIAGDYTAFSPEDAGKGWYAKPATLYAISKNTVHPVESAMLLDFMLNSEDWALLQGVEKGIPISSKAKKALDEAGQLSGLQYEASLVMDNNTKIAHMSPVYENTTLIDAFINKCTEVIFDKTSNTDAAKDLYEQFKEVTG
ncbi:MAG: carbohydrate ABC transporter substrate-binding protein [Ruminococcus sp.]|nr:carbohydrate ABC transporter substrate-binding protein [Ruminococcus sp.]